jgi:hypothetical protein
MTPIAATSWPIAAKAFQFMAVHSNLNDDPRSSIDQLSG